MYFSEDQLRCLAARYNINFRSLVNLMADLCQNTVPMWIVNLREHWEQNRKCRFWD